jgi:hypothetical protein
LTLRKLSIAVGAFVLILGAAVARTAEERQYAWIDVERVVVVGDVHGSYDNLVALLRSAGLIDDELRWTGDNDHFVSVGDLFDRRPDERKVMDLLMRLEGEAAAAGGRVHVLLGNHELMNLVRELRDVSPGSYAAFAAEETPKERRAAERAYLKRRPGMKDFDVRYPAGYFARLRALDPAGRYGRWLVELPATIKINDVLYVHGGLTERVAAIGQAGINRQVRDELGDHLKARERLEVGRVVDRTMQFGDLLDAAEGYVARGRTQRGADALLPAAATLLALTESLMFGADGPLWYRGNSLENERLERERMTRTLELLDADKLVVGHSATQDKNITSRFRGRLYRVDHGMYTGQGARGLVFENGQVAVLDSRNGELATPGVERPQGQRNRTGVDGLPREDVERLLVEAPIVSVRELGRGNSSPLLVEMKQGARSFRGVLKTIDEQPCETMVDAIERYQHEVAAYRLSRLLGLDLVPVTVVREQDGRRGSLQQFVEGAVDRLSVEAYGLEAADAESLERELARGRLFELLVGNTEHGPTDVLYLLQDSRAMCIDHAGAFSLNPEVDTGATELSEAIEPELRAALESLDRGGRVAELGELLCVARIDALLARRDALLAAYDARP